MPKFFSNIILPDRQSYHYDASRDYVKSRIASVLSKGGGFFTEPDIYGRFYDTYRFQIIVQPAFFSFGGKLLYTVLDGTILETAPGQSIVEIQVESSILAKFLFVFFLSIGLACIYHSIKQQSFWIFLSGVGLIVLGPGLVNIRAGLSKSVVKDRYERYLEKAVKSITSA